MCLCPPLMLGCPTTPLRSQPFVTSIALLLGRQSKGAASQLLEDRDSELRRIILDLFPKLVCCVFQVFSPTQFRATPIDSSGGNTKCSSISSCTSALTSLHWRPRFCDLHSQLWTQKVFSLFRLEEHFLPAFLLSFSGWKIACVPCLPIGYSSFLQQSCCPFFFYDGKLLDVVCMVRLILPSVDEACCL